MLSFFQAHRDEVITMVANPVVDQVISAGLGESKFFVLSITSKMFVIKCKRATVGSLSKRVFETRTATAREDFAC